MTKQFMLDISSYQSGITVQQIKASGAKAVVIKLTESTNYTNPYIAQQIKICKQAGIKHIHFYHFQRATSVDGLTAEANYCISAAKQFGYQGSFIFLDAELKDAVPSTDAIKSFYEVIRNNGYRAGFYTYKFMYPYFNNEVFTNSDGVWAAAYPLGNQATDQSPNMGYFPSIENCVAWQFTDNWCGMNIDCSYTLTSALVSEVGKAEIKDEPDTYLHSTRAKKVRTKHEAGLYDACALTKAKVIAQIPKGTTLKVVKFWEEGPKDTDLSRYKVEFNGKEGWVSGNDDIIESAYWLNAEYDGKKQVTVLMDETIYSDPELKKKAGKITKGDTFTITENVKDKNGYPRLKTSFGHYLTSLKSRTKWV